MRKSSIMGSSKYEFCPELFDLDVAANKKRREDKKEAITEQVQKLIADDPVRTQETFEICIEVLREIKAKYDL